MSNPGVTEAVDPASLAQYDMIIDVRSPGEFVEDHVPGAVNLPVLDDDERVLFANQFMREVLGPGLDRKRASSVLRNPEVLAAIESKKAA